MVVYEAIDYYFKGVFMRSIKLVAGLSCLLIVLFFSGCSSMKSTDVLNFVLPSNGYVKDELQYGELPRQQLDIYIPKSKPIKTAIVFIHGGAWRDGTKGDFEFVAHALTGLGHAVIIPNYRLYPDVEFPAFIDDVADAIAYVEKNALKVLGKPLTKIIMMGHSSGAHGAALLSTDQRYLSTRGLTVQIAGLIAIAGPYDLDLDNPEVKPVFTKATKKKSNPILNIHGDMPPVLLLHGQNDKRVHPYHTQSFNIALEKNSTPVTTHLYPGVDHVKILGSLAAPLRFLNNSYSDIKRFLENIESGN